jgi:NAD(P)H-flavin reductase
MMRYVIQAAIQKGIPEQQLWLTLERNMNCAIGLCGHCQLGPAFVCKDGPVFRYDQIETLLHFQDL